MMKRDRICKMFAVVVLSLLALSLLTVCVAAAGEPMEGIDGMGGQPMPGEIGELGGEAEKTSAAGEVIKGIFSGQNLALLGAALAVALPCLGSAKGVGIVGEASSGLLSENPSMFGKALALQALPMTQGVYGMVAAFLILNTIGLFGTPLELSVAQGAYFIMAALPIALAGYFSAIKQARVSAAGISLLSKRPGELGKAITSAALVETYAIFSLLITLLMVVNFPA